MTLRWIVAAIHLLALGIGLGAVFARGRALRGTLDAGGLRRVFLADTFWGLSAVLWIGTGLWRAFGGLEKGTAYYLDQPFFWIKMGLLFAVLMLELAPMINLIIWRIQQRKGTPLDTSAARRFAWISDVQAVLIMLMVFAATAMARGLRL